MIQGAQTPASARTWLKTASRKEPACLVLAADTMCETASASSMREAEHSEPVPGQPKGWGGEGRWERLQDGGHVHPWAIHGDVYLKTTTIL